MSLTKNLEFEKTSFLTKTNSAFIEQMYLRYINNDPELPDSWKNYFDDFYPKDIFFCWGEDSQSELKKSNNPIKNLIKHLEDHKVLLLLDNLENVLDNNIINFLEQFSEADHKSKIFITSRIPIGHGDIPIKVGPFNDKEALDFFERLSKVHQIEN